MFFFQLSLEDLSTQLTTASDLHRKLETRKAVLERDFGRVEALLANLETLLPVTISEKLDAVQQLAKVHFEEYLPGNGLLLLPP
jgi:hypothetical protein